MLRLFCCSRRTEGRGGTQKNNSEFVILYRRSTPAGAEVNVWEISLKFPSLLEIFAVGEGSARPQKTKALSFYICRTKRR